MLLSLSDDCCDLVNLINYVFRPACPLGLGSKACKCALSGGRALSFDRPEWRRDMKTRFAALAVVVALTGCAYREGGVGNPITRKFQYFSYLGGDDIRDGCVAG